MTLSPVLSCDSFVLTPTPDNHPEIPTKATLNFLPTNNLRLSDKRAERKFPRRPGSRACEYNKASQRRLRSLCCQRQRASVVRRGASFPSGAGVLHPPAVADEERVAGPAHPRGSGNYLRSHDPALPTAHLPPSESLAHHPKCPSPCLGGKKNARPPSPLRPAPVIYRVLV